MSIKKNKSTKYISATQESHAQERRMEQPPKRLRGVTQGLRQPSRKYQKLVNLVFALGAWGLDRIRAGIAWTQQVKNLQLITTLLFLFWTTLVLYWLYFPFNPVVMNLENGVIPVKQDTVVAGQQVTVLMEFDKRHPCAPEVKWFLIDGFVIQLSTAGIKRPEGKQTVGRLVTIPEASPREKVHLRIEYSCKVNPLRTIHYSWDTESFEVI